MTALNIYEVAARAIRESRGSSPQTPEERRCAVVMSPSQYGALCRILIDPARPNLKPIELDGLPIWTLKGFIGPAVVDRRCLVALMMVGAQKVTA